MSTITLVLIGVLFFAAVLSAVGSIGVAFKPLRLALAASPYLVACAAPFLFRRGDEGWSTLLFEALVYVALTWAMVWGLKRQLRG